MTIRQVIKRNGAIVGFTPQRISNAIYRAAVAVGGRDKATADALAQQVVTLLEATTPADQLPTVEEIQDSVEKVLIENGHAKVAKEYIIYREARARKRSGEADQSFRPSVNIPWAKIWHVLDWAVDNGVNTIESLNARLARGEFNEIVFQSERAYNEEIKNAVQAIADRREELRTILITGPSSSGKTTTTIKVGEKLKQLGMTLVTLNVDNYFFNLEMHPIDEFGDYDFETPQALDLPLVNQHLLGLLEGQEVQIPFYDFKTGQRHDAQTSMKLTPGDVVLIDSLHGLYPDMTQGIPDEQKFRLYLEPLLQMKDHLGRYARWTDIRLIRRMLRDAVHRAYDPRRTLEHWHYVRTSELRYIIPYLDCTDHIINTGLPHELPIYAGRMLDEFASWVIEYREDPLHSDAFTRAARVHKLLSHITPVTEESSIPKDSVLREFIGGSCYKY
ncbi:ATP cone domain-containing protein [Chloroflexota bacterium]